MLESRIGNSFVAARPPAPPPFTPALLAVGLCLITPVALTLALLGVMAPFVSLQAWGRPFLLFSFSVCVALVCSAGVRSLWFRMRLPGRGPSDFLPIRWVMSRLATRRARELVDQLASAPPGPDSLPALKELARALEKRDLYTRVHCGRVSRLCFDLVSWLGGSAEQCELAHLAGLLHDIGKLHIPDEILFKPSKLEDAEMEIIKTHPSIGADLVRPYTVEEVIDGVLHHHERMDGHGYPDALDLGSRDLIARAIPVCDTYDTLISDRPYRAGRSKQEAFVELRAAAGSQLDPVLVEALIEMITSRQGVGARLSSVAAFAPVGLFVRKTRHLIHASTVPATAAVTAATVAATAILSPPVTTPEAVPALSVQVDEESAEVPAAAVPVPNGSAPRAGPSSKAGSSVSRQSAAGQDPAPSSDSSPPPEETPGPGANDSCRIPVLGASFPTLPLAGCVFQAAPITGVSRFQ